jgi:hypothetical protein
MPSESVRLGDAEQSERVFAHASDLVLALLSDPGHDGGVGDAERRDTADPQRWPHTRVSVSARSADASNRECGTGECHGSRAVAVDRLGVRLCELDAYLPGRVGEKHLP